LAVESFEAALREWAQAVVKEAGRGGLQGVAMDGKVRRGSAHGELPGVHLLALLAHELGLSLKHGEVPVTTNEHKTRLRLLEGVNLTNQVITADAAFMQRAVCQMIIQAQGHYRIVLKANPADLCQTGQDWFEPFPPTG
jgi:hypothetical protein